MHLTTYDLDRRALADPPPTRYRVWCPICETWACVAPEHVRDWLSVPASEWFNYPPRGQNLSRADR